MIRTLPAAVAIALVSAPVPAAPPAPAPVPTVDLPVAVRCAALFGLVAGDQARGVAEALRFPPLAQRGREFFVRTGARLMDAEGLDRPAMQARMQAEVQRLRTESAAAPDAADWLDGAMRPCLALLDAGQP